MNDKPMPGVAMVEEVMANLDAAHTCKWKSLAWELAVEAQKYHRELAARSRQHGFKDCCALEVKIAKAREAGL